jgi:hypothetical protein
VASKMDDSVVLICFSRDGCASDNNGPA